MTVYLLKVPTGKAKVIEKILMSQDFADLFAPESVQVETTWNKPYMPVWRQCDPVVIRLI